MGVPERENREGRGELIIKEIHTHTEISWDWKALLRTQT